MMDDEKLKIFHKLFACMGLAPISTSDEKEISQRDFCKSILYSIPAIFSILVSLTLFQWSFFPDLNYGRILMILFNACFLMVTTSNVVANVQCLVYNHKYFNIVQRISVIHRMFAFQCKREVNYHSFAKFYRIKFFTVCFCWLLMGMVSYVIHAGEISELIFTTVSLVLESVCSMSCVHAILFIDLVGLFTEEMNGTIVSSKSYFQLSNLAQIRAQNLVKLKCLHFEIWNLVQQINRYFGWWFVTLFVKYLVDIIYNLYWIFIDFEEFGWKTPLHLEAISSLLYSVISLIFLINSSQYCSSESVNLIANIVKYSSFLCDNTNLFYNKQDIMMQIRDLPLQIVAGDLFNVDRKQLPGIIAGSCTYIIIFIQFYLASGEQKAHDCNGNATKR